MAEAATAPAAAEPEAAEPEAWSLDGKPLTTLNFGPLYSGLARTLKPFVRPQWCTAEGFYCEQAKRYRNREAYHLIFGMSFATSG